MAEASSFLASNRYAVVTGGNKGIGYEICRQLAMKGVTVVLTAMDEKLGLEAVQKLKDNNCDMSADLIVFHQLDVTDPSSVDSLANFIKTQFGKLDILVNNAGISGLIIHTEAFLKAYGAAGGWPQGEDVNWSELLTETYELAEECLKTNYYGAKTMTDSLVSLLQLSDSPRIVNVSSFEGFLKNIPNERTKAVLSDVESLTEERMDELLNKFLKDFEEGCLEKEGWPTLESAYIVSKVALNAYTRIVSKKYPNLMINCVCPGFVKTDMTCNTGILTAAQGALSPVRLALLPHGGPSGLFFLQNEISTF